MYSPQQQPWHTQTPESKLPQSDSRLVSAICRGICSNGRPCRMKLASPSMSPRSRPSLAPPEPARSPLFCHHHQSQSPNGSPALIIREEVPVATTVRRQSSIDTLVNRLGAFDVAGSEGPIKETGRTRPPPSHAAFSEKFVRPSSSGHRHTPGNPGLLALLCFAGVSPNDDYKIVRHKQGVANRGHSKPGSVALPSQVHTARTFHPLIPRSLPNATALALQAALDTPISPADQEGYIYMYTLTNSNTPSPAEAVDLLLGAIHSPMTSPVRPIGVPPPQIPHGYSTGDRTILVKIGRAVNVHQRLTSWSKQCEYNVSLLRFYPYVPGSGASPAAVSGENVGREVRKVPYTHKVERLIHIELAERRVNQEECASCGKKHREWFRVDASRDGIRSVDEVVKRWVGWAERLKGSL